MATTKPKTPRPDDYAVLVVEVPKDAFPTLWQTTTTWAALLERADEEGWVVEPKTEMGCRRGFAYLRKGEGHLKDIPILFKQGW